MGDMHMRSFQDEQGRHWQAAVLDASWGNAVLVFSRLGATEVLKAELHAANLAQAEQMLAGMDEAALRSALTEAVPMTGP